MLRGNYVDKNFLHLVAVRNRLSIDENVRTEYIAIQRLLFVTPSFSSDVETTDRTWQMKRSDGLTEDQSFLLFCLVPWKA